MICPSPHQPWGLAFLVSVPHGVVAGVHLPDDPAPVDDATLARLLDPERAAAQGLRGYRQVQFTGGRLAVSAALAEIGARRQAVLSNAHGAPAFSDGISGSVSHKNDLAVAMVARGGLGLGIDLEDTDHERPGIAARVLTPAELAANSLLAEGRRWIDAVLRFSVKEAVYKAIHPTVERYVGFGEVEVWPGNDGVDRVEALSADLLGFRCEARHVWIGSRVLSTVRARR